MAVCEVVTLFFVYLVLGLAAAFVVLLVCLLCLPITYELEAGWHLEGQPQLRFAGGVGALLGSVTALFSTSVDFFAPSMVSTDGSVKVFGRPLESSSEDSEKKVDSGSPSSKPTPTEGFSPFSVFTWPGRAAAALSRGLSLVTPTLDLLRSLWRAVAPHTAELEGTFGFDDPAATGSMHAVLLAADIPGRFSSWDYQPLFGEPVNRGSISFRGSLVPAYVILLLCRYLLRRPVRRLVWRLIRSRWQGRKSTGNDTSSKSAGKAA